MELRSLLLPCVTTALLLPLCLGREVHVEWNRQSALQYDVKYVTHLAITRIGSIEFGCSALCVVQDTKRSPYLSMVLANSLMCMYAHMYAHMHERVAM